MTRTPMARLPWIIQTRIGNSIDSSGKQIFRNILGFFPILSRKNMLSTH